jgi:hypothetical protein
MRIWDKMIANNGALAMFRDEDQLADILEKEFTLEKLYDIMHFAHGASDIRKTNNPFDNAEIHRPNTPLKRKKKPTNVS